MLHSGEIIYSKDGSSVDRLKDRQYQKEKQDAGAVCLDGLEVSFPTENEVTVWRGMQDTGDYNVASREVVFRRTVNPSQKRELEALLDELRTAEQGMDSLVYMSVERKIAAYEASLTEVFDVARLQERARHDPSSFLLCEELGIEVSK